MRILLIILSAFSTLSYAEEFKCIADYQFGEVYSKYETSDFTLYTVDNPDKHPTYSVVAKHKSGCITDIDTLYDAKKIPSTKKWAKNTYYYSSFAGGNSSNAQNRRSLIVVSEGKVKYAGSFSCVDDVDKDGAKDFCKIELDMSGGRSHVDAKAYKVKLVLINDELVVKK